MSAEFRLFPRIFSDVVADVRTVYDTANSKTPIYEFGTYKELTKIQTLTNMNLGVKYPLIWLVWEANDSGQKWDNSLQYSVVPRIFIINLTKTDYTSDQRYTANFEAVLYPLFLLLKQAINDNSEISYFSAKGFQVWEHLHWGESIGYQKNKNVLFDTLDALEIRFDKLSVTPGDC